ncbi:MAG: hypothetical protein IKC32_00740 [Clostridia bacterium]|nr:hypothetical protein [Clostridia bacterium]
MGEHFRRFKDEAFIIRTVKSALWALGAAAFGSGTILLLGKLELMPILVWLAILVGCASCACGFLLAFLLLRTSDRQLAVRLDEELMLDERLETMVEYINETGAIYELQRRDAEAALADIPARRMRKGRVWIPIIALLVGVAMLVSGILVPDMREVEPPPEVVPFELSVIQRAGINELISYVDTSPMDEPYKTEIKDDLTSLLSALELATTLPEMQTALAKAITDITESTRESSSLKEILEALWDGADEPTKQLVASLNSSKGTTYDWGTFAEEYEKLLPLYLYRGEPEATDEEKLTDVRWLLESLSMRIKGALNASGIPETDSLHSALTELCLFDGLNKDGERVLGIDGIYTSEAIDSYAELEAAVRAMHEALADRLFSASLGLKENSDTGEFVLRKLSVLFGVEIPPFERPDLDDEGSGEEDKEDGTSQGGGIGGGNEYGSRDLVLDPITGRYVEYGTLYAAYNAIVNDRTAPGYTLYTEEQKKIIKDYFDLLYTGFDDN